MEIRHCPMTIDTIIREARGRMQTSCRVGAVEVTPLWDGPLPSSLEKIPDPQHRAEAERLITKAGAQALTMNVYGFLLRLSDRLALIDVGAGQMANLGLGRLAAALAAQGVAPAEIKTIFITHMHRDHFGGLATADGKAAFPNAELVLHETEVRFWLDGQAEAMPARARRYLEATRQVLSLYAPRLRRVKDLEGSPEVTAHPMTGHTPGHTGWMVRSGAQAMLAWGDLIHIAQVHLPSPYIAMEYDLDPAVAKATRLVVLDWVARERIAVAGAHLPSPGIGVIVRHGHGYAFEPDRSLMPQANAS
jgi:glyoxylase-like metal-dependent hydrolase (beta-lactamase superfamily II)